MPPTAIQQIDCCLMAMQSEKKSLNFSVGRKMGQLEKITENFKNTQ
jgi:hypothetical protein